MYKEVGAQAERNRVKAIMDDWRAGKLDARSARYALGVVHEVLNDLGCGGSNGEHIETARAEINTAERKVA